MEKKTAKRQTKKSNPIMATVKGKKGKTKSKSRANKSSCKSNWRNKLIVTVLLTIFFLLIVFIFVGKKGHKGIDVSHHQGDINWASVVHEGEVEFAYIKATEGTDYKDKKYKRNRDEARAQGIPVGPYHFFRADKSGQQQFEFFSSVVDNDFDLIPVLDLEELGGKITDKDKYRNEVKVFIKLFTAHYGYKPFVYGSHSFLEDNVYPVAEDCDYWLAWYLPLANHIRDKRRFLNSLRPGLHARMWQYTDKGEIPGIVEKVDLDECWEIADIKVK
ncbi:MAG: glycoside hydrolase family 25 protein [Bacteroidales bacterium]|nr:glycoside hydrolase family 25 protein [Bacteroidales bacterium]MCF0180333.1 glycoside hydrolase family 25 protein [Bacteroidales bacterium]